MTPPNLTPKNEHAGRSISIPYEGLYRAMRSFLRDLESAEQEYHEEVARIRQNFRIAAQYSETVDVERYSLAVQVFAAMTIEAAISFYAVLRFGGETHDDYFRWDPPDKRLRKAFAHAGIAVESDAEILNLLRSVMDARNRIVHPFSVEFLGSEQANLQLPDRPGPDESAAAARKAVSAVDRFLELLRNLDDAHSHFFVIS